VVSKENDGISDNAGGKKEYGKFVSGLNWLKLVFTFYDVKCLRMTL
jgi:hypothetical protein